MKEKERRQLLGDAVCGFVNAETTDEACFEVLAGIQQIEEFEFSSSFIEKVKEVFPAIGDITPPPKNLQKEKDEIDFLQDKILSRLREKFGPPLEITCKRHDQSFVIRFHNSKIEDFFELTEWKQAVFLRAMRRPWPDSPRSVDYRHYPLRELNLLPAYTQEFYEAKTSNLVRFEDDFGEEGRFTEEGLENFTKNLFGQTEDDDEEEEKAEEKTSDKKGEDSKKEEVASSESEDEEKEEEESEEQESDYEKVISEIDDIENLQHDLQKGWTRFNTIVLHKRIQAEQERIREILDALIYKKPIKKDLILTDAELGHNLLSQYLEIYNKMPRLIIEIDQQDILNLKERYPILEEDYLSINLPLKWLDRITSDLAYCLVEFLRAEENKKYIGRCQNCEKPYIKSKLNKEQKFCRYNGDGCKNEWNNRIRTESGKAAEYIKKGRAEGKYQT
jgi:hypothetical protein